MTHAWHRTPDGYESSGFRIRSLREPGRYRWRLEVRSEGPDGTPTWHPVSYHRRLRTAQLRADRVEKERLRHRRIVWRVVVGALAFFTALFATTFSFSVGALVVAIVGFGLAARAWAGAVALRLGEGGPISSSTRLERWAFSIVDRRGKRTDASHSAAPTSQVFTLPPHAGTDEPPNPAEPDESEYLHANPPHVC